MDLTLKLSHMMCDVWQLENGTAKGTVLVYDQRGFGLSHMARASLSSMRNMMSYVQVLNELQINHINSNQAELVGCVLSSALLFSGMCSN